MTYNSTEHPTPAVNLDASGRYLAEQKRLEEEARAKRTAETGVIVTEEEATAIALRYGIR